MYDTLTKNALPADSCERPNFDNVFAFMNGFPIEKTRVVIIGQDPAPKCESTGYAFHGSDCEATHKLVRYLIKNDQQFMKIGSQKSGLKTNIGKIFNLDNWIEQGYYIILYAILIHLLGFL